MQLKMCRLTGTFAIVLALATPMLAACGNSAESPKQEAQITERHLDGYALQGDPKSVVEYTGNKLIFTGEVLRAEAPRKVDRATEAGDRITYIYTPVRIRISQAVKGPQLHADQEIVIRVIGGQFGTEKTVSALNPAPEKYRPGLKLFLFTGEFVDAGDGLVAATPNFTYAEDSAGNVYNLHEPEHKTSLSIFSASVTEWVALNRS